MKGTPEQEEWASQFTCDVHGRMTWATVRTDKTCGVTVRYDHCKRLLNRGDFVPMTPQPPPSPGEES